MTRFLEVKGWNRETTKAYDAMFNIEHVTRIAVGEDGRAVVNLVDGSAITVDRTYGDIVTLLTELEGVEVGSTWRTM